MKRMLVMLLATLCLGCTSMEYGSPTEAGWRIFRYTEEAFGTHRALVLRAAQLDEYLRQTTDAERRRVHDRYFPRERIVEGENGWLILSTHYTWTFELTDDKSLAQEGAEWRIRCTGAGGDLLSEAKIGTADGVLAVSSFSPLEHFSCIVESGVRLSEDDFGALTAEFFRGEGSLWTIETPALDIDFTISEPVIEVWPARAPVSGTIDIEAFNHAEGPFGADETVTGHYLAEELVEIDYCGKTERWSLVFDR